MFHRVRSEAQKPQNTAQESATKTQAQKKEQEELKPSSSSISSTTEDNAAEEAKTVEKKAPASSSFTKPETTNNFSESQQKESKMSDQNDQTEDKTTAAGTRGLDMGSSPYGQQTPPLQRSSSPYAGGTTYPGFAAGNPAGNSPAAGKSDAGTERRLVIGQGITMSGEIESCDHLLVEGTIEAALKGANVLEVSETGTFYGTVEIKDATIAGRFEGDLTVDGRLVLKAGGVITGSISYRELQIEVGAIIDGKLTPLRGQTQTSEKPASAAASAPTAKNKAATPAVKAPKAETPAPANTDGQLFAGAAAE